MWSKMLGPEPGLVAVDDDRREQPGVDHLEQVLVLEELLGGHQLDRFQARSCEGRR